MINQDHVHVSTTCYASTLEVSKYPPIHKIKLQVHVWHHSLSKICQGYGVMQKEKEKKRCIPKEGMPHASACQKKNYIASYPKRNKKRDGAYKGVHTPSTKNIHTLALLDQDLWLVSPLNPVFDSAKYEKQVCHHILHTYRSTKKKPLGVGWKRKAHKKALVRNETLLSDPRDHPRNLQNSFQKLYKSPGLMVEQRSG